MAPVDPSRRRLLKLGFGGAIAVAVGGGTLRWLAGGYASQLAADDRGLALSRKELAVVRAFVTSLLPGGDGFPAGVDVGVHQRIDEEMWATDAATRGDMKNGLQLFEHAPVLHGFPSRFTSLDAPRRLAYVALLLEGKPGALQQVALALKEMTYLFYYVDRTTWTPIGYDGPWVPVAKPPASRTAYAALLRRERQA
jgi:hypothetical protein